MQGTSLSEAWVILTEKLIQLVEENVPVSKVSSAAHHKNLYVSHQCMVAIQKKNIQKKYLHNKSDQNYTQYKIAVAVFWGRIVRPEILNSYFCFFFYVLRSMRILRESLCLFHFNVFLFIFFFYEK